MPIGLLLQNKCETLLVDDLIVSYQKQITRILNAFKIFTFEMYFKYSKLNAKQLLERISVTNTFDSLVAI